jgi:hypothetical protein
MTLSCEKSERGAYLVSDERSTVSISGPQKRTTVTTKIFSTNYHIKTERGFVYLNGDQITKMETVRKGDNWDVIFFLPDGTSHTVAANQWTKSFVTALLEGLGILPTGQGTT